MNGVSKFLRAMGFNDDMTPIKHERKMYDCPQCGKKEAYYVEEHPDTDMNEIVLKCKCGYVSEEKAFWRTLDNKALKDFQKKCKHEWRFEKDIFEGQFFRCEKCGCQGKQTGKQIKRVKK
jgi:predicted  nucleic acid-binding Zn ribbon protein